MSPSSLIVGGIRKLSSISNSQSSQSDRAAQNTKNSKVATVNKANTGQITKKRGSSKSKTVISTGSHDKSCSSDYDSLKRSKSVSKATDATHFRCDKYTDQEQSLKLKSFRSKQVTIDHISSQLKNKHNSSSKGVTKVSEQSSMSSHAPTDEEEYFYSDSDEPSSSKRRRIITIGDSSDTSDD